MKSTIKSAKTVDEAIELGLKDLGLSRNEIEYEVLEDAKSGFLGIFGSKDAIVKISQKEEFKIDINDIYGKKAFHEEQLNKEKELAKKKAEEKAQSIEKFEAENKAQVKKLLEEEKQAEVELEKKAQVEGQVLEAEKQEVEDDLNQDEKSDAFDKNQALNLIKEKLESILKLMHIEAKVEADMDEKSFNYNLVDISEEDTGIIIGRKGETLDSLQYILSLIANKNSSEFMRVSLNVANYKNRRKEAIENNARKLAFKVIKTKRSIALEPMNSYERRIVHYALQKYKEVETVSQGSFPNRKVIIKYKN